MARAPGQYTLVLTATSPTLHRQHTRSFPVRPACFQPALLQNAPVTVQMTLSEGWFLLAFTVCKSVWVLEV